MPNVRSYGDAVAFLVTRQKPVPRKKISNNTYVERRDEDTIAVRLHDTDVVTFRPRMVTLTTGDWLTVTTASRINDHLPAPWCVRSNRGTWELRNGYLAGAEHSVARYVDGITLEVSPYGSGGSGYTLVSDTMVPLADVIRQDRHNTAVRRMIGKYVKGLPPRDDWQANTCTLCMIDRSTGRPVGRGRIAYNSYGDSMGDTQHLVDHMQDRIYTPALPHHAVTESGYTELALGHDDFTKRILRKYLGNRLYVGATAPAHGKRPVLSGVTA